MELDKVDRRILALLQSDASLTGDTLAEKVGRSPSVVARRIRRLRAGGAIAREVAILAPELSGYPLSTLVKVYLQRHESEESGKLRRTLTAEPRVQLILDIAGELDIVLLVVSRDMADYDAFADAVLEKSPAVQRFESHIVKKRHKVDYAIPI
ncbi:Lrp/AsnC family transcriptional regulator [Aurantiacibacter poecillastricola]|uniref:Lrp/AsnC family transcriptional regulator n=1 Tax=Aurantiacibacter poecillastricola TaxID=3064385 RepID=UPI00273F7B82|nr:Lrp/AsnC family transcriptional regulator [Aurantiacibacter sp. 219JJ12-13]MDP5261059.1 Lrp/AsnC family transcriptional regulator [Aurantiacibacter sp. 219JJ12-13]